jgi:lipopolysaccharide biosynthesis glycosyltransferase
MKYKIYIGYDPREHLAYDVARHSILTRTDPRLVHIVPLELKNLGDVLTRPIENRDGKLWCPISEAPMATEFAISRFCIPLIQNKGWALFVDCDIICLADISELFALADSNYAVMVVKHNQESGSDTKMDGQVQTYYSRKNWSSVVLWNLAHPSNRALTLEALNTWPGRDLHAFKWLKDEEIGSLPQEWNHLVGVTPDSPVVPKILHYTLGGPWFKDWKSGPLDDVWSQERTKLGQ